ncbi:hypothetical protein Cob_v003990 [Colletotrichum orbiculare MAFF 240422]|uniref:Uncharacterized protein n=1 Tax=Colletotrichum orbiculare (strain 104-T / ATCC 96160 / CBS 514.97 / LARS 414 / MAFF 240422) TaxID=1213857 RepID=A0A484FYS3_COLOR|nr:hypothetical protein Cob_v003990 [Colletotrichum orbiculare MAFF 240422]
MGLFTCCRSPLPDPREDATGRCSPASRRLALFLAVRLIHPDRRSLSVWLTRLIAFIQQTLLLDRTYQHVQSLRELASPWLRPHAAQRPTLL